MEIKVTGNLVFCMGLSKVNCCIDYCCQMYVSQFFLKQKSSKLCQNHQFLWVICPNVELVNINMSLHGTWTRHGVNVVNKSKTLLCYIRGAAETPPSIKMATDYLRRIMRNHNLTSRQSPPDLEQVPSVVLLLNGPREDIAPYLCVRSSPESSDFDGLPLETDASLAWEWEAEALVR